VYFDRNNKMDCIGVIRSAYKILVGNPELERQLKKIMLK
jgi:hypothetical protein